MTGSTASGNSQPIQVNTLTSQVTQHGNMTLVNSPKGVTMAWEAPATMDVAETSRYLGVNNLRHEVTTDMATGETSSVAYTEFTHEEYEAYRNSRQGRVLELPPQPPEKQGNTLGRITFTPAPASTRAEYANPPEPLPAEKEGDTPNPQLQALIDKANDDRSLWQRTKDGASSAWDSTKRVASASWENPGEFGKGVAKGIGNLPSDLANLVVEGAKSGFGSPVSVNNYAKLLDYQAMNAYEAGNITQANQFARQANSIREFGQVGDIFEIKNDAQQGGSIASIFVPLGTLVKAPAAAAKGMRAAKAVDAVTDTSKVANVAGDANKAAHVDDVSKIPEPKGPNGNGGKVEPRRSTKPTDKEIQLAKSKGNSPQQIAARKKVAENFYAEQGMPQHKIAGHTAGIDYSKPVDVTTLPKGKYVNQYQAPNAAQGSYYSEKGIPPTKLGIADTAQDRSTGIIVQKEANSYQINSDVKVLRSTASKIEDTWSMPGETIKTDGGATQYFTTETTKFTRK